MRALQLGAGDRRLEGATVDELVRVDIRPQVAPDVLWDLDRRPWPFESSTFDLVDATDVIEHLQDVIAVMEEIHRVSRAGAVVRIVTPHFSSSNSFTDPTHRHHLGFFSFDYFTDVAKVGFYTAVRFRTRRAELVFHPTFVNKLVWRLARRWPGAYERRFCWLFPA